jgi:hypothetical protein
VATELMALQRCRTKRGHSTFSNKVAVLRKGHSTVSFFGSVRPPEKPVSGSHLKTSCNARREHSAPTLRAPQRSTVTITLKLVRTASAKEYEKTRRIPRRARETRVVYRCLIRSGACASSLFENLVAPESQRMGIKGWESGAQEPEKASSSTCAGGNIRPRRLRNS